jgi:single-stranded-DNA-specific exonuclease
VGILASRIKDKIKKPTIAFANSDQETIKGSGRSTKGIHLRDTLDEITKKDPDLIIKFGGHAAAAGLEIEKSKLDYFSRQFDDVVSNALQNTDIDSDDFTDGELSVDKLTTEFAQSLSHIPWGQSFPEPTFQNEFEVVSQKLLKDAHLKLILRFPNTEIEFDAIYFNQREFTRDRIKCIYRVDTNDFYKHRPLQLIVNQLF